LEPIGSKIIMTILVISHTNHYYDASGRVVGFVSTVKEINFLADTYGSVIHIGCLHDQIAAPVSAIPYSDKVTFVPIPPYGGQSLKQKLSIITNAIKILATINKELRKADVFQFRAPTSMGLYVIPFLTLFSGKKGWYKYAGNWEHPNPPLSYVLQKYWLLNFQKRPVTINGKWPAQPLKCLTFENPCLGNADREDGASCLKNKLFSPPYTFCFVGRLESEKGAFSIINALKDYPDASKIAGLEIVGEGVGRQQIERSSKELPFPVHIHGAMPREKLFEIYKKSHFIILPSESEGFPKVIAEAANFGCIPIVSDVSCIGQYINAENGFLWNKKNGSFEAFFQNLNFNDAVGIQAKAARAYDFANSFTYEWYVKHLSETILKEYNQKEI
jgi:glycosyltransferase involved in cell wall biosynthesis